MTLDQEHLITLLLVKHGGFQNLVDTWLYADDKLSTEELDTVNAWLGDEQSAKPHNLSVHNKDTYTYLTAEIELENPEKD